MIDANVYSAQIAGLADYGIAKGLIEEADRTWAINALLAAMGLEEYEEPAERMPEISLEMLLGLLTDLAVKRGMIQEDITSRDLFDTGMMGTLTPRPSWVIKTFQERYSQSPQMATDWYYTFSQDTDYIRRYRIAKEIGRAHV